MPNIIITGDLLRVNSEGMPTQSSNIKWFYHLFSWQINSVLQDATVKILLPDQSFKDSFGGTFFRKCNLESTEESWVKIYGQKDVPSPALDYFENIFSDSFIIGYELPDVFLNLFDKCEIKYLDFAVHPVRFLDDIFFGVRTNCPKVFSRLISHALSTDLYHVYAGIHRGTLVRKPSIKFEQGSCVLVGQTEVDKSLIKDGHLLTVTDFEDKIHAIADGYSKIYFKPHPYAKNKNAILDNRTVSRKVNIIDENIYRAITSEEVSKVFSISSSVCFESIFFGKDSETLFSEPLDKFKFDSKNPNMSSYVPLLDDFYKPNFWADILAPHFQTCCNSSLRIPLKTSRLRTSLGCYWGYNFLDAEILFNEVVPKFISQQSDQRCFGLMSFLGRYFRSHNPR